MKITVARGDVLARESRALPAASYNLLRILYARSEGTLFVPLRPMQVLAIADAEEVIFVNQVSPATVDLAWQHFCPQRRSALDEPVSFEALSYTQEGLTMQSRVQSELHKAMLGVAAKQPTLHPARVIALRARQAPSG